MALTDEQVEAIAARFEAAAASGRAHEPFGRFRDIASICRAMLKARAHLRSSAATFDEIVAILGVTMGVGPVDPGLTKRLAPTLDLSDRRIAIIATHYEQRFDPAFYAKAVIEGHRDTSAICRAVLAARGLLRDRLAGWPATVAGVSAILAVTTNGTRPEEAPLH